MARYADLSNEEQQTVRQIGELLLAFGSHFTRGTFTNAYVWVEQQGSKWSRISAALVGNPLKIGLAFGYMPPTDEDREHGAPGRFLDHVARRVFGPDEDIFRYERSVHLAEFLQRLADALPGEAWLTVIPEPGYPWPADWYWDAKKARVVAPPPPAWLIEVEDRMNPGKKIPGVDPCLFFPAEPTPARANDPVMGDLGGMPLMAAHSIALDWSGADNPYERARSIRDCGGFLFPSLSVGPVPAANFGYGCFVARLGLVLDSLKPYRPRGGERSVWVFPTDVWTGTVRNFVNTMAHELFDELHGHDDYTYGYGFAVLGTPRVEFGGPAGGAVALDRVSQLKTALRRRMKPWLRVKTLEEFEALEEAVSGTDAKYAYCEAKARSVIALSEFPYFVVPSDMHGPAENWAAEAGYKGEIVAVDWKSRHSTVDLDAQWNQWQWGLRVAQVVRELRPVVRIET